MDAQQLQQLLTAITTGLTCPAGAFALAPGQVERPNKCPRLYTTSSEIKIWHEATAPLPFKFNVKGKEVNTFCEGAGTCTTSTTVRMDTYRSQCHHD
jgi:hypothetical protein